MRNLKRALSLLLSSTMVLGMVVMGGSAAGYQDVDASNDNQEAIEVLQAVGIMSGVDDKGNFNPDGSLTRNEMAVVMAHLLNLDYDYYRGVNTFTDVPEWAAPYVAACVAEGVTAGIGNGLYGGDQKITAAQAGLMVMKALGYFQNQEDFGSDWQVATIRQASYINLFDKVNSNAEAALTRGQVAQLVLNGLKSNMVTFTGDKGVQIGDVSVGYHAEYTPVTNAASKYNTIITGTTTIIGDNGQYYVQLGEELYDGKLKLANGSDDFERPSRVWSYDGQEIGTYAKKELIVGTYTKGVTGKEMYDLLTASTIKEYTLASYVDGGKGSIQESDLVRSNNENLSKTGNGVLTEVYVDNTAKEITIVSVNTWLAQAYGDYSESKEYAPLKVFTDANGKVANYNVDVEDVPGVADVTNENFYLVNISYKNETAGQVVAISNAKVMENSTITKWSKSDSKVVSKVTVDGTEYNAAAKAFYDEDTLEAYDADLLTDMSYNVYLDQYGYVIGVSVYEGNMKYVFITGYDRPKSNLAVSTATAGAIFLDGTMEEIKVDVQDTNANIAASDKAYAGDTAQWTYNGSNDGNAVLNRWYSYSVNENGVYTLKPANMVAFYEADQTTIDTANVSIKDNVNDLGTRVYGEDASTFITVDTDIVDTNTNYEAITDVTGVYTGVQSVDLEIDYNDFVGTVEGHIYAVYDKDYYIIGAIALADATGSTANYAYILDNEAKDEELKDGVYYWTFDAFMGGEIQTLTAKSKYTSIFNTIAANQYDVLELRFDADGYVVKVEEPTDIYTIYDEDATGHVSLDKCNLYSILNDSSYEADQLTLQGRTLYVTADQKDEGLALAADAKALVIQPENGKSNVETEFSSVSAALSYLADPNPSTSELEYNGDVVAVLNSNGNAAWVVFKSNTELVTGSSSESTTSGDSYTANAWSDVFGFAHAVINYERPAYVPANDDVEISFDVFANGKLIDSVGPIAMGEGADRYTYGAGLGDGAAVPDGATVTVGNVKFYPTEMKVQYKLNGKVLTAAEVAAKLDAGYPTTLTTDDAGSVEFKFVPADEAFEAGTYTYAITGVSVVDSKDPELSGTDTVGTGTTIAANNIYATGKGYVTVSITATEQAVKYTVDLTAVDGDAAVTLEGYNDAIDDTDYGTDYDNTLKVTTPVAADGDTGDVVTGTPVDFTVTLSSDPSDADAYRVVIKKLGIDGYVYKDNLTLTKRVTVTSDITIAVTDVVVTPVALPEIKSVSWTDDSVTINFTKAVIVAKGAVTKDTDNAGKVATVDEAVTGDPVTVTSITYKIANGTLVEGYKLKVDAEKILGATYGGKLDVTSPIALAAEDYAG